MSLIDDLSRFVKDLVTSNTKQSDDRRTLNDKDIRPLKEQIKRCIQEQDAPGVPKVDEKWWQQLSRSIPFWDATPDTVDGLECGLRSWASVQLALIENFALVRRPTSGDGGGVATAEAELALFNGMAGEAREGAVRAFDIVVSLNLMAAIADSAAQLLSLGQIRIFQDLVQNIIWSLGISDLAGLVFRPAVAASYAPLLERHANTQAQAQIPNIGDLIRFLVREVFDPARRAALEADKTPEVLREFMRQRGFADFWTDSYWAAHWNLLSTTQLNEAVHRGYISQEQWREQVRLNDVVPEGIPWLEQTIYAPYTRVDARRMADLGLLADEDLLQAYCDIGYFAPKVEVGGRWRARFVPREEFDATVHTAQGLVVFTRIYNVMPDIRRRLSNGFLRPEAVEGEIRALGVPDSTARRLTETLVKAVDLGEAAEIRNLTTAQIVRGAKNGLISFEQGEFLLRELGWSAARAEFMLRLQIAPEDAPTATDLGRRLTRGE